MDTRLSAALDIINDVKTLDESSFQFSKHQCTRLVEYYGKVGEFFEHVMGAREDVPVNLAMVSLDATISVLQKGQVLLTKYTADDWQTSLMTEGLNQGSFEALHRELKACVQSIHENLQEDVPGIRRYPFMNEQFFGSVVPFENHFNAILMEDAERDRINMLAKIEAAKVETVSVRCLSMKEKSSQMHSLIVVSKALEAYLPSVQWIEQSEIELLEVIGSGGNAVVHKCRWSGREYAVKILDTKHVDGLKYEVEKLVILQHPNIVPLIGCSVGNFEPKPMIVMELLDGDLGLLLRRHPLSWSKIVDVMHKIATGMTYLHRQGIFHGDLKSKNVLVRDVDSLCEVKITDFGVSKQIPRPSRPTVHVVNANNDSGVSEQIPGPTEVNADNDWDSDYSALTENASTDDSVNSSAFSGPVGTRMWMAPEVLTSSGAGNNLYSAKADVYSFAMLCVELITGGYPYREILGNIKDHVVVQGNRPRLPEDLPSDLRELIIQCWDEEPQRRPAFPEICLRLQKLKVHSPRLRKLSWRSQVLHNSRFCAAVVIVLALVISTSVNQVRRAR